MVPLEKVHLVVVYRPLTVHQAARWAVHPPVAARLALPQ